MATLIETVTVNKKIKLLDRSSGYLLRGIWNIRKKRGKIMPTQIKRIRFLAIL